MAVIADLDRYVARVMKAVESSRDLRPLGDLPAPPDHRGRSLSWTGIRLEAGSNAPDDGLLLSRRMDLELVGATALRFAAATRVP